MENKHNPDHNIRNGFEETPVTDGSKAQTESKYDSHPETKPHQENVVDDSSNPDRVSHDNTDSYLDKLPENK